MSKDLLTTIAGMVAAIGVAAQAYMSAPAFPWASPMFWMGLASAAGMAAWGYWTNKK